MVTMMMVGNAHLASVSQPTAGAPSLPSSMLTIPVGESTARKPREAAATDTLTVEVMSVRNSLLPWNCRVSRMASSVPNTNRPSTTAIAYTMVRTSTLTNEGSVSTVT